MRTKHIIFIVFLFIGMTVMAQPLPPSDPQGNPVPVEGLWMLPATAFILFGAIKLRNRKR